MKATLTTSVRLALCLSASALTAGIAAAAEPLEGVLDKGANWSALFSVSPESGDLIGYAFNNQSLTGKAILAKCLPGLFCSIEKAATREMRDTSELKFADNPSGWMEITQARNVGMKPAVASYDKKIKTRHGVFSVNEDNNTLQFRGKPVLPRVEGNNSMSLVAIHEIDRSDVLLLQNNGGGACPALYRFITVGPHGIADITATPEFGTCSDLIYPASDGKGSITVAMPGFAGTGESRAVQNKAGMTKTVYRYQGGKVSENGRPHK
jgi:hypothetical protein